MTREEISLLLYFETCVVDRSGFVHGANLNEDDYRIARQWDASGYVVFRRLKMAEFRGLNRVDINIQSVAARTDLVRLSDEAWRDAAKFRRQRADRSCDPVEGCETVDRPRRPRGDRAD